MGNETNPQNSNNVAISGLMWTAKVAAIALTLAASSAGLRLVLPPDAAPFHAPFHDQGPLTSLQALVIANIAIAGALCLFASQARTTGSRLAAMLFVALFGLQSFMMILDGLWFNNTLQMSAGQYLSWALHDAVVAATVALAMLILFRPGPEESPRIPHRIALRLAALTAIYVVLYFAAGMWAWQHPALQTYYAHMQVAFGPLVAFQFFRGLLWALMALFLVTGMRGSLMRRALVMAVLFGAVTSIQLLYPNPVMPWSVRQVHMIEVGVSEFIYGVIATLVLLAGVKRQAPSATGPRQVLVTHA